MRTGPHKHFGAWLRAARLSKGWSGERLGLAIGSSQGNISLYERGLRRPHAHRITKIAGALDADLRLAMEAFMADAGVMSSEAEEMVGAKAEVTAGAKIDSGPDFALGNDCKPDQQDCKPDQSSDEAALHELLSAYSGSDPALVAAARYYREMQPVQAMQTVQSTTTTR